MTFKLRKQEFKIHWAWVVLGSSFATLFISYSIRIGAYSVLLPEMIREFGISKAEAGMIKSAFSVAYLIFSPVAGWLTDQFGGRRVVTLFCLFVAGGTLLMATAKDLTSSLVYYSLVGLGASATWVPLVALIQNWFGERKRGLALGILSPSYGIGFGLMGLILPSVVFKSGWRVGWFALGLAGLVIVVLNGLLLRDEPRKMGLTPWGELGEGGREGASRAPGKTIVSLLRKSTFWIVGSSYFLISYGTYTLVDFIVTYGVMELKLPYLVSSLFITVIAWSGVVGGFLLTTLSDRVGRRRSLIVIQSLIAAMIVLVLAVGRRMPHLMVVLASFGFLYGPIWPLYGACARDYFPKEMTGAVFGGMTIFYGLGAMISPVLTGHLADLTGTFRWSFGLGAVTALGAALLFGLLRRAEALSIEKD